MDIWPLSIVIEAVFLDDYVSQVSNKLDKKIKIEPIMSVSQKHPYHLVDPSPWPFLGSLRALANTIGGDICIHSFAKTGTLLNLGLGMILYTMFVWWCDVIRESIYKGHLTFVVQLGFRYGMILFIVFEVMSFLAFFWVFFLNGMIYGHSKLACALYIKI